MIRAITIRSLFDTNDDDPIVCVHVFRHRWRLQIVCKSIRFILDIDLKLTNKPLIISILQLKVELADQLYGTESGLLLQTLNW